MSAAVDAARAPGSDVAFTVGLFPYDRWGGVGAITEAVQAAEELGFAGVTLPDHVVMPVRPDRPPVSTVWYDDFVLATHLAAHTRRLRLLFNVLVVPYRPPVQLAKLIATLDVVSGGRLTVGVGTGWLRGEFRVLGVPHAERGAITDEYLRAMKVLWTEAEPSFDGHYTSFGRLAFEPRCHQQPHVPLWIGGSGRAPLRRVLELGDGWTPMAGSLEDLRAGVEWLRANAPRYGRDPDELALSFRVTFGGDDPDRDRAVAHASGSDGTDEEPRWDPDAIAGRVAALRELGFRWINVAFDWATPDEYVRRLTWFAQEVAPRVTSAPDAASPDRERG